MSTLYIFSVPYITCEKLIIHICVQQACRICNTADLPYWIPEKTTDFLWLVAWDGLLSLWPEILLATSLAMDYCPQATLECWAVMYLTFDETNLRQLCTFHLCWYQRVKSPYKKKAANASNVIIVKLSSKSFCIPPCWPLITTLKTPSNPGQSCISHRLGQILWPPCIFDISGLSLIQLSDFVQQSHYMKLCQYDADSFTSHHTSMSIKIVTISGVIINYISLCSSNHTICSTNFFQQILQPPVGQCFVSILKCIWPTLLNAVTQLWYTLHNTLYDWVNVMSNNWSWYQK